MSNRIGPTYLTSSQAALDIPQANALHEKEKHEEI